MSMSETLVVPQIVRDPKLGIKSSIRYPKREVALLALLYLSNPEVPEIAPFESGEEEHQLTIAPAFLQRIRKLFIDNGIADDHRLESIESAAQTAGLCTTQMEPLIVLFELLLPLAEVCFVDSHLNAAVERTGQQRYPKKFAFSTGLDRLCGEAEKVSSSTLQVFECWLRREKVTTELISAEKDLAARVFSLAARAQFTVKGTDSSPGDTYNVLGLYTSLINGGSFVLSSSEAAGPLRILKSAIRSGMFPGLELDSNAIKLVINGEGTRSFSMVELSIMVETEKKYQELQNVANVIQDAKKSVSETDDLQPRNVIYYGVPGSGKSYEVDHKFIGEDDYAERVVFHPDYLYSNFVGQVFPAVEGDRVTYAFRPGPFARVLKLALAQPERRHILVIEEINRGNASAVFGDIFQLLDRDPSGASRYSIHNADISTYISDRPDTAIRIPSNMSIVATMNTSDQNVFTLDTAFQRRWSMRMVPNDISQVPYAHDKLLDTSVTWQRFNTVVNQLIVGASEGLVSSEDKRLGAFFVSKEDISIRHEEAAVRAFAEKVLKFLWDDAFKFNRSILFYQADRRSLEDVVVAFSNASGDGRWQSVFTEEFVLNLLPKDPMSANSDGDSSVDFDSVELEDAKQ